MTGPDQGWEASKIKTLSEWGYTQMKVITNGGAKADDSINWRCGQVMAASMYVMELVDGNASWASRYSTIVAGIRRSIPGWLDVNARQLESAPRTVDTGFALRIIRACIDDPDGWKLAIGLAGVSFQRLFEDQSRRR